MACDESLGEFLQGFVADSEMQSPGIPLEEPGRGQRAGVECANIASPTFPGVVSKGTPAGDAQPTKRDLSRAFFEAKVKHSKVERPVLPWEKGVMAARHSLPSFPTMVPRIEHLDPRNAEPDAGVTVGTEGHGVSHGGETIFDSCISFRSAWTPASDDVSREVASVGWLYCVPTRTQLHVVQVLQSARASQNRYPSSGTFSRERPPALCENELCLF